MHHIHHTRSTYFGIPFLLQPTAPSPVSRVFKTSLLLVLERTFCDMLQSEAVKRPSPWLDDSGGSAPWAHAPAYDQHERSPPRCNRPTTYTNCLTDSQASAQTWYRSLRAFREIQRNSPRLTTAHTALCMRNCRCSLAPPGAYAAHTLARAIWLRSLRVMRRRSRL